MNLISNLDCVVSMDSLVMHLASLMATPTVSVWGATHPGLGFLGYGFDRKVSCRPISLADLAPYMERNPVNMAITAVSGA